MTANRIQDRRTVDFGLCHHSGRSESVPWIFKPRVKRCFSKGEDSRSVKIQNPEEGLDPQAYLKIEQRSPGSLVHAPKTGNTRACPMSSQRSPQLIHALTKPWPLPSASAYWYEVGRRRIDPDLKRCATGRVAARRRARAAHGPSGRATRFASSSVCGLNSADLKRRRRSPLRRCNSIFSQLHVLDAFVSDTSTRTTRWPTRWPTSSRSRSTVNTSSVCATRS